MKSSNPKPVYKSRTTRTRDNIFGHQIITHGGFQYSKIVKCFDKTSNYYRNLHNSSYSYEQSGLAAVDFYYDVFGLNPGVSTLYSDSGFWFWCYVSIRSLPFSSKFSPIHDTTITCFHSVSYSGQTDSVVM
jgi:hypothetical protein